MKVKSETEVTQWCPTLRDPMDCSLPGSSAHGIFQARVQCYCSLKSVCVCVCVCVFQDLLTRKFPAEKQGIPP